MLLDTSGLQSDLLVVEARARGPFFWARVTKKWGTAKVARFTVPKKFSGSSKDCKIQFSLYCATKLLGTAKVARFTVPKIFLDCKTVQQRLQDSAFTVRQSFWEQQR